MRDCGETVGTIKVANAGRTGPVLQSMPSSLSLPGTAVQAAQADSELSLQPSVPARSVERGAPILLKPKQHTTSAPNDLRSPPRPARCLGAVHANTGGRATYVGEALCDDECRLPVVPETLMVEDDRLHACPKRVRVLQSHGTRESMPRTMWMLMSRLRGVSRVG